MFGIGFTEIILIAVLAVVVLGPDKLPQLGKTLARVFSEFNKIKRDFRMTISDIEKVGEKATSDIRSEVDKVGLDSEPGKDENGPKDTGLVADDIDEVPEVFEPEPAEPEAVQKPGPRRRRRAPGKAGGSGKPDGSGNSDGSRQAPASQEPSALPKPDGTREAAASTGRAKAAIGTEPEAAEKPRRRRRPAASRAASTAGTKPAFRARTSKAGSAETSGAGKDTARVSRSRRKPGPEDAADSGVKKNAVNSSSKAKSRTAPVIDQETKPEASPESLNKKGEV